MNVVLHEFGTVNHTDIICEIDFECEQERYKQRLIMKFAPTTLQSGESRTLCGKHNIYIFSKKVAKTYTQTVRGRRLTDAFLLPSLRLKIFMNHKIDRKSEAGGDLVLLQTFLLLKYVLIVIFSC